MIQSTHFSHDELKCKCNRWCDGDNRINPVMLQRLEEVRRQYGKPIKISSGYRCFGYNAANGWTQTHSTGHAVDIAISGRDAIELLGIAIRYGFTGIGLNQKGDYRKRFIHLDDLPQTAKRPRPHIWTYD